MGLPALLPSATMAKVVEKESSSVLGFLGFQNIHTRRMDGCVARMSASPRIQRAKLNLGRADRITDDGKNPSRSASKLIKINSTERIRVLLMNLTLNARTELGRFTRFVVIISVTDVSHRVLRQRSVQTSKIVVMIPKTPDTVIAPTSM